ncbi:MAG TPA: NAD(P)-dependent oxidoreductase [Hyphomicrobiaceae bacterium]|nr:NAD(P)-dependent oxidoreductase [Hyphomicrobiaceae bacterium]
MTRVLVTGARGFVGRWIAEGLVKRGHDVHGATSADPDLTLAGVTWHLADLMQRGVAAELMTTVRPELLVHAAWFTGHGAFWTSDLNYRWVAASLELIEAFASTGGKRFVGVGSCAEYDWRHGFCAEGVTPLVPGHPYGVCKVALMRMAEAYAANHGLSFAWARIFYPFGQGEPPARLVSSVIRALQARREAPCTAGTQVRDFLHVADCGDAIAALAASPVGGAVNIGCGEPRALRDVVMRIADRLEARSLVKLGALPMRPDDPPVLIPDVRRLGVEVGWSPARSIDAGLDEAIAWWSSRGGA